MNVFEMLVLAHFIADWLLQSEYQATEKFNGKFFNSALITHCMVYTLCFVPVFWIAHLNWLWLLPIFWSHMFLDRRWPVKWWIRNVMRTSDETIEKLFWLVIVVDQVMHVLILALIVILS